MTSTIRCEVDKPARAKLRAVSILAGQTVPKVAGHILDWALEQSDAGGWADLIMVESRDERPRAGKGAAK